MGALFRDLCAADLDRPEEGTRVRCAVTVTAVHRRRTPQGLDWAVLDAAWQDRELRLVVFPTQWAATMSPRVGDPCVVTGTVSGRSGGEAVIRVLSLGRET